MNAVEWTLRFWRDQFVNSAPIQWWLNRPLGYSELHVCAEASVEEVKHIIQTRFGHRLPEDPRDRAFRIKMLLDAHCEWQRMTRSVIQRPHVAAPLRCRKCGCRVDSEEE